MADVVMPQLGETVTEGTVTRWYKSVGERVERDEPLFEVSTDKVDSEVPSPAEGILEQILVPEGETVDVGTVLAVLGAGEAATLSAPSQPPSQPQSQPVPAPPAQAPPPKSPAQSPSPPVAVPAAPAASHDGDAAGRVLSPVVRRLLDENGIDAREVKGSGVGGRITRSDVLAVIDTRHGASAPAERSAPAATAIPPTTATSAVSTTATDRLPQGRPSGTDEIIAFTNIRRRTAEHMVRSQATSAHTLVALEADYEAVERLRRSVGQRFKQQEGFSLTYLPFIARAVVEGLHQWPYLNSSVGDDSLIVHHQINLGIAVDLGHQGLIVPVIRSAEELTLRGIARRIHDLAERARTKKLSADDISGGTFSLTNAGPYGTFLTAPIINQPQIGILSTDGVKRRPVVVTQEDGTEAIAIHSMGLLCLSWDHRAVDGAYAAAFVARVTEVLRTHDWGAEL